MLCRLNVNTFRILYKSVLCFPHSNIHGSTLSRICRRFFCSKTTDQKSNTTSVEKQDIPGVKFIPDTELYKRVVRGEPGKVIFGFIPEEWALAFIPKTGVTGFYTFLVSFGTYLISKEIYVMEHEYYTGLAVMTMSIIGSKKFGKNVAKYLDAEVDSYERHWNEGRDKAKQISEDGIRDEEKLQWSMEGQKLLVEAKRENVDLQLEAIYRERLLHVYKEVKKGLDYQVEAASVNDNFVQKNIVDWVIREVHKSLSTDVLEKYMDKCIDDLAAIISKNKETCI